MFNYFKNKKVLVIGHTGFKGACGFLFSIITFIIGLITLITKLINWNNYPIGIAVLIVGVFFIGSVQIFFIGLLGEYILNINLRVMNRPLVIEERRINFDK